MFAGATLSRWIELAPIVTSVETPPPFVILTEAAKVAAVMPSALISIRSWLPTGPAVKSVMVSLANPARNLNTSLPAPPVSVSLPPPPFSVSFPAPPATVLANSLPVSDRPVAEFAFRNSISEPAESE